MERALAALEGRNVENAEHLVMQRAEAQKRRADLERVIAAARAETARRKKRLPVKIAAALAVAGGVAVAAGPASRAVQGHLDERERLVTQAGAAAKPFERRFSLMRTELGTAPFTVAATEGRCFVAVAASALTPPGEAAASAAPPPSNTIGTPGAGGRSRALVRVERGPDTREASSVGWCSCKAEEVRVTAAGPDVLGALVLQAPADAVGGADVLGAVEPRPETVFPELVDRACVERAFDEWAAGQRDADLSAGEALSGEHAALVKHGLPLVAAGSDGAPFVLVPPPATDVCALAVREGGGALSLRRKGGERALSAKGGAIGFCAKDAGGFSVWGEGTGTIALFAARRSRVGGLVGLKDMASRAGLSVAVWAPAEDLAQDARDALAASGIPSTLAGLAPNRPQVIALSTDVRSTLTPGDARDSVVCRPPLDVGAVQTLCLEARPGAFAPGGTPPEGLARGPQPLWLALPPAPDAAALGRALDVLAFARRMNAQGFELTSLVGATFTPKGLKVSGRNGENEVVAMVVSANKPHLHTLSSGAPWTLADPGVTALAPSDTVELVATPRLTPGGPREFIVWRR